MNYKFVYKFNRAKKNYEKARDRRKSNKWLNAMENYKLRAIKQIGMSIP